MAEQLQTARAVIFNEDGALLLVERHKGDEHYFVLPGGHIDQGETPEGAVIREVHEETGLAITVARLLYLNEDKYLQKQNIFLCDYHGGEIELQSDSIESEVMTKTGETWEPKWFSPAQLRDLTIYPEGLVNQLEEDIAVDFTNNPREIVESDVV